MKEQQILTALQELTEWWDKWTDQEGLEPQDLLYVMEALKVGPIQALFLAYTHKVNPKLNRKRR